MGMMGGWGDTGRQDCLGREEPVAELHPDVAGDWAGAVTGCHRYQLAFGLGAAPRSVPPSYPPSQMWRQTLSWVRGIIGVQMERPGREGRSSG